MQQLQLVGHNAVEIPEKTSESEKTLLLEVSSVIAFNCVIALYGLSVVYDDISSSDNYCFRCSSPRSPFDMPPFLAVKTSIVLSKFRICQYF